MTWLVFCPHREEKSQPDSAVVAISRYFSLAAVPERLAAASTSFLPCHDGISACSGKVAATYGCCTGPGGRYQHMVRGAATQSASMSCAWGNSEWPH